MSSLEWTRTDRFLHWTMAALFVWQVASRWISASLPQSDPVVFHLNGLHSVGGFLFLLLAAIRLAIRLWKGRPPLDSDNPWETAGARVVHALLYVAIFVQPISGLLSVGDPQSAQRVLAITVHVVSSYIMLVLVGIHIIGALWHHFGKRDATLIRMLKG